MRRFTRRIHVRLAWISGVIVVAAVSISVALLVTPMQQVTLVGQTVAVGAAAPSFSVSGPGELDLFGQRLPTTLLFAGPVRPRLALTEITLTRQLATAFAPRGADPARQLGRALASGWERYFGWEIVITAGCAVLLTGALAGWLRLPRKSTLILLATGLAVTEAINIGGIMVTAYTAPSRLQHITSITALAGTAPLPAVPRAPGPPKRQVEAVVMGDSTAAGIGNPAPAHPGKLGKACQRSADTYAVDLGQINNWKVLNLACSGATIPVGILGPQPLGRLTAPPQFAVAKRATRAGYVIVSVGADDLGWSGLLQLCAVTPSCNDKPSTAYFQQRLNAFAVVYYQMLRRLRALPSHPTVLVNLYYNPFDTSQHCLDSVGLTPAKERSLIKLLDALNHVLANGAKATGLIAVQPDFTGHALCDPTPYVQGLHGRAPFHPTLAGELAMALADAQALREPPPPQLTPGTSPDISATPGPSRATVTGTGGHHR